MNENEFIQSLQTLEEHQHLLTHALITAKEKVLIASPYISISAIISDNIATLIEQAIARDVKVQVFVDSKRNCYNNMTMKDRAIDSIAMLMQAGAQVGVVNGLHCRFIARDNDLMAEGSFNWLSAILIRNGEYEMDKNTLVYVGEIASNKILHELTKIEDAGYGFASIQEDNGIEITKTGKVFGLFSILILPTLIGNDLGNRNAGFVSTAVILFICAIFYLVKFIQSRNEAASVQQR